MTDGRLCAVERCFCGQLQEQSDAQRFMQDEENAKNSLLPVSFRISEANVAFAACTVERIVPFCIRRRPHFSTKIAFEKPRAVTSRSAQNIV